MPSLTLRPSHKAVAAYYESLAAFKALGTEHELAVKTAFATLLETAAKPFGWKLVPEHSMRAKGGKRIQPDGTLMDVFRLQHGHWEAKDSSDDLNKEIRAKLDKGYPTENLLFWEPRRAVLYQHGNRLADVPLDQPEALLGLLKQFLEFAPEAIAQWEAAVAHFKALDPFYKAIETAAETFTDFPEKQKLLNLELAQRRPTARYIGPCPLGLN